MAATELSAKKRFWTPYGVLALLLLLGLLMATLLTSTGPLKAAFRAEALIEANRIDIGCQSYKTEYGTLPPSSENYRLTKILRGDNPRKIDFLSLRPKDVSPNGENIDPWGTPFRIMFDSDSKVHVVSAGPDKIFGTPDDITNQ